MTQYQEDGGFEEAADYSDTGYDDGESWDEGEYADQNTADAYERLARIEGHLEAQQAGGQEQPEPVDVYADDSGELRPEITEHIQSQLDELDPDMSEDEAWYVGNLALKHFTSERGFDVEAAYRDFKESLNDREFRRDWMQLRAGGNLNYHSSKQGGSE